MLSQLKHDFRFLRDGKPGRRFRDFSKYKRAARTSFVGLVAIWIIGFLLIIVGLAVSWIPGPGGFLSVVGIAIIAPYIPGVPAMLDHLEKFLWRTVSALKRLL